MKNLPGVITVLLLSQPVVAEEINTNTTEAISAETQLIESDAEVTKSAPSTSTAKTNPAINEQSGFSRGSVVRSAFTREVSEREPTENLQKLTNESGQIKFFTELRDMSGQTAIHRWEYEDKVVAEVEFNVKGPRWRVWSSKNLVPQWTGDWKVSVINGAGEIISEKKLSYDVAKAGSQESSVSQEPEAISTPTTPDNMQ